LAVVVVVVMVVVVAGLKLALALELATKQLAGAPRQREAFPPGRQ
jgi:hypothetical protein